MVLNRRTEQLLLPISEVSVRELWILTLMSMARMETGGSGLACRCQCHCCCIPELIQSVQRPHCTLQSMCSSCFLLICYTFRLLAYVCPPCFFQKQEVAPWLKIPGSPYQTAYLVGAFPVSFFAGCLVLWLSLLTVGGGKLQTLGVLQTASSWGWWMSAFTNT